MKLSTMTLPTGEFVLVISEVKGTPFGSDMSEWRDQIGAAGLLVTEQSVEVDDAVIQDEARRTKKAFDIGKIGLDVWTLPEMQTTTMHTPVNTFYGVEADRERALAAGADDERTLEGQGKTTNVGLSNRTIEIVARLCYEFVSAPSAGFPRRREYAWSVESAEFRDEVRAWVINRVLALDLPEPDSFDPRKIDEPRESEIIDLETGKLGKVETAPATPAEDDERLLAQFARAALASGMSWETRDDGPCIQARLPLAAVRLTRESFSRLNRISREEGTKTHGIL